MRIFIVVCFVMGLVGCSNDTSGSGASGGVGASGGSGGAAGVGGTGGSGNVGGLPLDCFDDEDCRLFSSNCDDCVCIPLGLLDEDPVCDGAMVDCIVDPCANKTPICNDGSCGETPP